jgi:hypothetical protein
MDYSVIHPVIILRAVFNITVLRVLIQYLHNTIQYGVLIPVLYCTCIILILIELYNTVLLISYPPATSVLV